MVINYCSVQDRKFLDFIRNYYPPL